MRKSQFHSHAIFFLVFPVVFLLATCFFFAIANAADVTLAWDANTEGDLAGYKLYYDGDSDSEMYKGVGAIEGDSPVVIYLEELADPDAPTYTVTGLQVEQYYYFALTAFNSDGMESDFSEEVGVMIGAEDSLGSSASAVAYSEASDSDGDSGGDDSGGGGGCFISDTMAANSFASQTGGTDILLLIIFTAMMWMGGRKRK